MAKMRVTVVDRARMARDWGSPGLYTIHTQTVEIDDRCPRCGVQRGQPWKERLVEDGHAVTVDRWENECGHVDKYDEVLIEAMMAAEEADLGRRLRKGGI